MIARSCPVWPRRSLTAGGDPFDYYYNGFTFVFADELMLVQSSRRKDFIAC